MSDEANIVQYGNFFSQTVAETAASTIGQITGGEWHGSTEKKEVQEQGIAVQFSVSGAKVEGEFAFSFTPHDAVTASRLFVGDETPIDDDAAPSDEENEALDELLRQIAGAAATALRPQFGRIELRFLGREAATWQPAEFWNVTLGEGGRSINFALHLSSQILDVHEPAPEPAAEAGASPLQQQAPVTTSQTDIPIPLTAASKAAQPDAASTSAQPPSKSGILATPVNSNNPVDGRMVKEMMRDGNLNLLLDLEMDVTLRFGRREMLMKEILELCSGSVVELDRMVQEPVDLLIDNKIIARGEVVIVNGNYGLRVVEVASPQQKIEMIV